MLSGGWCWWWRVDEARGCRLRLAGLEKREGIRGWGVGRGREVRDGGGGSDGSGVAAATTTVWPWLRIVISWKCPDVLVDVVLVLLVALSQVRVRCTVGALNL